MNAKNLYERVLSGESVNVGNFLVSEDYLYTREKSPGGQPKFKRVLAFVYDHEDEDVYSTEEFDGTLESFVARLEAHVEQGEGGLPEGVSEVVYETEAEMNAFLRGLNYVGDIDVSHGPVISRGGRYVVKIGVGVDLDNLPGDN